MTDVRLDEVQAAAAPTEVVRRLLDALVYFDRQALEGTLADDVVYTNVSLPTIRGRQAVGRALAKLFVRRRSRSK